MPSSKSKPKPKPNSLTFEAIGTQWVIEVFDSVITHELEHAIHDRIATFDKHYSRFRADSLVTEMAQQAGSYILPEDSQPMLDLYAELYEITEGGMTPLIGQTLVEAGYDAEYSLQPKELNKVLKWSEVLNYDFPKLELKQPALLDFGAVGKGYLVDIVAGLLADNGHTAYCVDAGGDMIYYGTVPLEVGLEHPADTTQAIGIAKLQNQALCGSAGNRRAWQGYHHILDPSKLQSPQHIKALWVSAASACLADGLTTALFFVAPEVLLKRYTFEYAIVYADYSLQHSTYFPAQFFGV